MSKFEEKISVVVKKNLQEKSFGQDNLKNSGVEEKLKILLEILNKNKKIKLEE